MILTNIKERKQIPHWANKPLDPPLPCAECDGAPGGSGDDAQAAAAAMDRPVRVRDELGDGDSGAYGGHTRPAAGRWVDWTAQRTREAMTTARTKARTGPPVHQEAPRTRQRARDGRGAMPNYPGRRHPRGSGLPGGLGGGPHGT